MIITRMTPVDDLPELLRGDETAAWLDCSPGTIYEMVRTGQLPGLRLGRLLRIPCSALAALLNVEAAS